MTSKFYALVVGINAYPTAPLRGCVDDAKAMGRLLEERIDSKSLELVSLYDQDATRERFIDTFRRHLGQARDGDQVLLFFAGHGSRQEMPPKWADLESDGQYETLVLQDSRSGSQDLADKELGFLLSELTAKAAPHVAVLLDSCHSGGATRLPEEDQRLEAAVRELPMDPRSRADDSFLFAAQLSDSMGWSDWPSLPSGQHVLLSACRGFELAQERRIDGEMRGLFSFCLVDALSKIDPHARYLDLHKEVQTLVHLHNPRQWPTALGDLEGRIFDGYVEARPQVYYVRPLPEADGAWRLDAGRLQGVHEGSELAVFPAGTVRFDRGEEAQAELAAIDLKQRIADIRVTQAGVANSVVELAPGSPGGLPESSQTLPAVVTQLPLPALRVSCTGDSPFMSELEGAIAQSPMLAPPTAEQPAWAEVRLSEARARLIKPGVGDLTPSLPIVEREGLKPILYRLEHLARWRTVFDLRQSGGRVEEEIEWEVLRWLGPPEKYGEPPKTGPWDDEVDRPEPGVSDGTVRLPSGSEAQEGEEGERLFTVRLTNKGHKRLFFALLAVSESFSVQALDRGTGWLGADRALWLNKWDGIPAYVPDKLHRRGVTLRRDLLLLIVSEVEFDVSLLEHRALVDGETRQSSTNRDQATGTLEAYLRRIDGNFREIGGKERPSRVQPWITRRRMIPSRRPTPWLELADGNEARWAGLAIRGPRTFEARLRPHNVDTAGRRLSRLPSLPSSWASSVRPIGLVGQTLSDTGLGYFEIRHARGSLSREQPLEIRGFETLDVEMGLLVLAFDGERLYVTGSVIDRQQEKLDVQFLPATPNNSCWLISYQIIMGQEATFELEVEPGTVLEGKVLEHDEPSHTCDATPEKE